jgi:Bacterial Ig domain/Bacterial cadherin-like domain/SdrD B-like domain/Peptidase M10 serralysin C terminal/RTX calcium-binding nonapeptide repeat (4 copies)
MTLGDRVYVDANANGIFDAGEGKNGVALTLFADTNNNGVLDIGTDVQLLTTVTAGTGGAIGSYSFANLSAGNYIVRVDASNFSAGGALAGTRGVFGGLDPDNNTDNDDNGVAGPGGSVVAAPITLAYGTETTSDGGAVPKNDINNTLDFGFVVNSAPVANADSVSATEDTQAQYSTELTGNDTDADLDTLTITAVSNFVNGTASVASGIVTFTPNANFNGQASFDYTISDGNGHTATATATVTVSAVSDPVTVAAPGTLALNEDSTNVAVTGLSIADVDSALAPSGVYEVTLASTHGTLTLSTLTGLTFTGGSDGTADATMTFHGTLANINTALATAKYTPDSNYNGSAQISLNATDSFGGVVATGSGSASSDSKNVAVTVNSVNDAPSGTDESSPVVEGNTYTFDATNFTDGFSDPIDGNAFKAVIITTLPATGTLKLNGVAISSGATITLADLNSHLFTYDAPAASGGTHSTFTFQVQDNGGLANGGVDTDPTPNTYTVDIAAANAAPVLDLDGSAAGTGFAISYTEGAAAAAIADTDVTITDPDSGDDIVSATVTITNPETGDKLDVGTLPSGITVDPSSTDTMVKLVGNPGTTADDFETALQAITYSSTSDDPTDHGSNTARTVTVVVNDGAADSNVATTTITVTDDNADAPTSASSTITAVEDTFRVIHVSDLGFNDVDGTLASVTFGPVDGGKIYYDADGAGGADPVEQTTPVNFTAQDLDDGKVSFKADANANGVGEGHISFAVIDDDNNVGQFTRVLTVDVTAVNDSPVLTASTPVNATEQMAAFILAGVNVSDVDLDAHNNGSGDYAGASFGVNRNPASNTDDEFDLVAGPNFTVDGINLKTTGGQIFGYINANGSGVISVTFTSQEAIATSALVDEVIHAIQYTNTSDTPPSSVQLAAGFTDGSPGGGQGAGATGLDVELVTVNIAAVNDAPVNSLGGTIGTGEDASNAWLSGMSISDPDADPANDDIYATFQVQHGTLDILTNVSGGIQASDILAQSVDTITVQATLNEINATLAASNGLTYSPNHDFNGDDTLTVTTNDAGHNGTDPGLTGDGTTEEDVDTRTISVSAVDDPPVAVDDSISTNENAVKTGNVFDPNPTTPDSDVDGPALTVSAVGGGTVGTQFALASGALLTVNSDGSYSYDPNGQFNYLVPASSGAVNTTATDTFTYTLQGGNTATVTVTINGVDSAGNVYNGDGTDNTITSGSGNDTFNVSQGGNDTVSGHDGNDYFYFGDALTPADSVDGGLGTDVVAILGDYSMTFGAGNLVGIERLTLLSGGTFGGAHVDYALTTVDANVAAGQQLTVLGVGLQSDETLLFNGSAETDGSFYIAGGAADDTLVGGQKNDSFVGGGGNDQLYGLGGDDWLLGGAGADTLRGGTGKDSFVYQSVSESTAAATDHILDFEDISDHIDLSAIDANSSLGGDQAFDFIGQSAFSNTAGELRIAQSGSDWMVMGDVNGDGTADFQVLVSVFGGHIMGASDFVL